VIFRHLRNVRGFFSDYYLGSVFGRGRGRRKQISDRETGIAYRRFLRIYERAEGRAFDASLCREQFIRPLLRDVLGFHLGAGENRIHYLFRSAEDEANDAKPLLPVYCGSWDEDLDSGRGSAVPMRRLERALTGADLSYGFLITGECIRLVRAPGDGPRGAYLEVDLAGLATDEDPESFAVFYRLFTFSQYQPDDQGRLPIRQVEAESREHAEKVSEDLKRTVFTAAESLTGGLLQDAVRRGSVADPATITETERMAYRDAALTALYRILFILYAEARDPRLDEHKLYREAYSILGLVDDLLRDPTRDWPENSAGLWMRLKALFRIYDQGLPRITPWEHIPPRGGDLFKADTPDGRLLDAAELPDRIIVRVLLDLTTTAPRRGIGRERVSFRELDIEQLGAVYEGLLEYEPQVAQNTTIEVRVQGRIYALPPGEIARLYEEKALILKGDFAVVAGTEAEYLHPEAPEEDDGEADVEDELVQDEDAENAQTDIEGEEPEDKGVKKGAAARLVRRLERGDFHFVPGSARKGTGSFYTPLPLVRDLVYHALGPLAEGKSPAEIESLRVLDPACGSAHFLVEAMRFLGRELHRAYAEGYGAKGPPQFRSTTGQRWDSDWQVSDEEARATNSEARAWCKRRIAERCLFGVDLNPTAVNLARVALWIESLAGDRPLTYFEHHVRCGNSLLGTWLKRLDDPPLPSMEKRQPNGQISLYTTFADHVRKVVHEAAETRRLIDRAADGGDVEPETIEEQEFKQYQLREAERILGAARLLFDLRSSSAFIPEIWGEWTVLCGYVTKPGQLEAYARSRPWWDAFEQVRRRERFLHWELEFPEVFLDPARPGFDVVLGNPPWDKIKPDKKEFYGKYDIFIRAFVGGELDRRIAELHAAIPGLTDEFRAYEDRVKTVAACLKKGGDYEFQDWKVDGRNTGGDPDKFKFFVERAHQVVYAGGRVGLVVPSAIYNNEGCTGLRYMLLDDSQVERFYAFENRKKIFDIDSRYKFVNLVFRKGKPEADGFEAAFMRHELDELISTNWKPWMVPVKKSELKYLSSGTLAFLEYRNPRDREIVLRMYEGRPLLGDQGSGTWNARFYTEFHMTNDRELWTDPRTGKLWNPRQILGNVPGTTDRPPYYDPAAWPEIRERMAEKGFWPLYEGKHIEQFLVDIKPIERWVRLEAAMKKYDQVPDPGPKVVFRDIASNTNERTCIAAVLPEKSCAGHTLARLVTDEAPNVATTVLNAIVVDFTIRLRTAATHLSFTYMSRVAVPQSAVVQRLPSVGTMSALTSGAQHVSDLMTIWDCVWSANRAVAEAYGLTPDDFEYILSTFLVFARKCPEFYAYLRERVSEWKRQTVEIKREVRTRVFPKHTGVTEAAEASVPYGIKARRSASSTKSREAPTQFKQAVIFAWVVYQLYSPGYPVSRYRAGKMIYLIERAVQLGLFRNYLKQAAGPYDPNLRYRGPEGIATHQRQWLVAVDDTHFEPGPRIDEALNYAERYIHISRAQASAVIKQFRTYQDDTLGRWTTVDLAARELIAQGSVVTVESILAHLSASEEWAHKLDQKEFTLELITGTLSGLRNFGFLSGEREGKNRG